MNLAEIIFYAFAALTIASGIFILFTKNILYAGFALLCTFLGVAAIYVFAGADFLAVTQIMIYVGGILVLILFGIMLSNRVAGQVHIVSDARNRFFGILISIGMFVILLFAIIKANFMSLAWIQNAARNKKEITTTVGTIGDNLMTDYVLAFEVAGIILMIALMGAAYIASQVVRK